MKRFLTGAPPKGESGPQVIDFKRIILNALNIEPGEGKLVGVNLLQSFFIGMPRLFTMTAANTLYLKYFGSENLPYVYIATAVVVPLIGFAHLFLEKKMSFQKHTTGTLMVLLVVLAFLIAAMGTALVKWTALCLLIWYTVEWVLSNAVFWNTANRLFTVRQAKRVFGLIGTGEVLAMILGGMVTPTIVAVLGTTNLLFLSMIGNVLALLNFLYISRSYKLTSESDTDLNQSSLIKSKGKKKSIYQNRYIILIFSIVSFIYFTFYFVDNAFYQQVESQYTDEVQMAAFLGKFFAVFGILNFFIKIFISGKALTRLGVRGGLLTAPFLIAAGVVLVVFGGVFRLPGAVIFQFVVLTKLLEGIFVDAITRPAYYTLFQPLPANMRASSQSTAESVVAQIAGGIAGAMLLFLNKAFAFDAIGLCAVLLVFLIGWIAASFLAGKGYQQEITKALTRRGLAGSDVSLTDPAAMKILEKGLASPRQKEVIYCLNVLADMGHPELDLFLLQLMEHPEQEVREEVYKRAEKVASEPLFERLKKRLEIETSPHLKGSLIRALAATGGMEAFDLLSSFIDHNDLEIRLGAIVGLVRHCGIEGAVRAGHRLIGTENSESAVEREFAARVLGEVGVSNFYRGLLPLLADRDVQVRKSALTAAGKLNAPKLWPIVIENITVNAVKSEAVQAILRGNDTVLPALEEAYHRDPDDRKRRVSITRIIGRIGDEQAVSLLKEKLGEHDRDLLHQVLLALKFCGYRAAQADRTVIEAKIAYEIAHSTLLLTAINDIGEAPELLLLRSALQWEMRKSLERIFLLLSFIYSPSSIMNVWSNYAEVSAEKRAYAIELFDTLVEPALKKIILPLLDDMDQGTRLKRLVSFFPVSPMKKEPRILEICAGSDVWRNGWIRACALDAGLSLKLAGLRDLAEQLIEGESDDLVAETGRHVLSTLESSKRQGNEAGEVCTMPAIEKVKILKQVNIFSRIPDEALAEAAPIVEIILFRPGETVFQKGELGTAMYLVVEGCVRVFDRGRTLAELGKGNIFGELAALSPEPRSASIMATENSMMFHIPQHALYDLISERIEVARGIIQVLCKRLQDSLAKRSEVTGEARNVVLLTAESGQENTALLKNKALTGRRENTLTQIEKVIILKTAGIFADTANNILAGVADYTEEIVLDSGETLFEKGDLGTSLYIVVSGMVRVHDGDRTIVELGDSSLIGELAALSSEPRTASITALSDVRLLSLDQSSLYELMWDQKDVVKGIIQVLIQRLRSVNQ